jgi:FAD/FMN-containing dehydrogenase
MRPAAFDPSRAAALHRWRRASGAFTDHREDGAAIAAALRASIRGEVRFDTGSRALYATDASNYHQVPVGVVVPRDAADVVRTLEVARAHRVPVLGRGAGTSLAATRASSSTSRSS